MQATKKHRFRGAFGVATLLLSMISPEIRFTLFRMML
jgi:hypothetical protein